MKAAYAKQSKAKQAARRPGRQAGRPVSVVALSTLASNARATRIGNACLYVNTALLSAVLWPDYTRTFVTASARSGRRRAPHSAGRLLLPAVDNQSIRLDW
ncbi:hypothetical protein T10_3486 [Trichinella papuae]|uniref:Uncharacterized protein n=1 Tax=Trichinella papuae TaxID=268474 RepID=A0A0V1N8E5_9BILA|nr:hypothetical protein T10_3486 [Trichinella papuae]